MLLSLEIKNAALIKSLTLDINKGMTVFTGETGAGKSVILNSINLLLGARTDRGIVRFKEKKATIQGMFSIDNKDSLESFGIECEDDFVVINREIFEDGKNVCRVNGTMVPLNVLREISKDLINIHGQHDNQALLTPSKHIEFLDKYADDREVLFEFAKLYSKKCDLEKQIEELVIDEAEKTRNIDLLSYQKDEIEKAKIKIGEKEELLAERTIIQNSEKISQALSFGYDALYNRDVSAYDLISKSARALEKIAGLDQRFDKLIEKVTEQQYIIEDLSHEAYELLSEVELDEGKLNSIEERLDLISRLERKYGGSEEKILEYLDEITKKLEIFTDSDKEKQKLKHQLGEVLKEANEKAEFLHKMRSTAADKLSLEIKNELKDLDMPNIEFSVAIEKEKELSKKGYDRVEFLISANKGEPLGKLDKIASGGELARVMLAMKSILADSDDVDTLIFDEIDTGVSGSAAKKIALKLSKLAEKKQVICVSHQPQLSAAANNHIKILKSDENERTITWAIVLDWEERVKEIARIIDGDTFSDTSIEHAKEMLCQYKKEM